MSRTDMVTFADSCLSKTTGGMSADVATRIISWWRGTRIRLGYETFLDSFGAYIDPRRVRREECALAIQGVWRGAICRTYVRVS